MTCFAVESDSCQGVARFSVSSPSNHVCVVRVSCRVMSSGNVFVVRCHCVVLCCVPLLECEVYCVSCDVLRVKRHVFSVVMSCMHVCVYAHARLCVTISSVPLCVSIFWVCVCVCVCIFVCLCMFCGLVAGRRALCQIKSVFSARVSSLDVQKVSINFHNFHGSKARPPLAETA